MRTAVLLAAEHGHLDVVFRKPVCIDETNDWSVPERAARGGHYDLIELCLRDERLDPSYVFDDGTTLLYIAAECKQDFAPAIRLLLTYPRIDNNATNGQGRTALSCALSSGSHPANILALLEAGLDPSHRDKDGRTPLANAISIWGCRPESIELLLRTPGVDPNAQDREGCTPLILAAREGQYDVFPIFLSIPETDPNVVSSEEKTAPHYAIIRDLATGVRRRQGVKALLEDRRVDVQKMDSEGWTPAELATRLSLDDIMQLLQERGRC